MIINVKKRFDQTKINSTKRKRFVLFARDQSPRNGFELAISAVSECLRMNILDPNKWEFVGVGGSSSKSICNLGMRKESDACIRMILTGRRDQHTRIFSISFPFN